MTALSTRDTVPAPFVVAPTNRFDGDDGEWSTFALNAGTPPQTFRFLPATIGQEIWLPSTLGCDGIMAGFDDCGDLRGANAFQGKPSRGYNYTASTSFELAGNGIFQLSTESYLYGTGNDMNAYYGYDNVSITALQGYESATSDGQTIAAVPSGNFWLANVGLGTQPSTFTSGGEGHPSLLSSLSSNNFTTSLSYGYTAGQAYASPPVPGSLILGGYDQARLSAESISFPFNSSGAQRLELSLQQITATQTLNGSIVALQSAPISVGIDSATSQLWLPNSTCQAFQDAFGLIYDPTTELYIVNTTIHRRLQQSNPQLTFAVGSEGGTPVTIVMHYNAFDLNAGIPLFNTSTPYFPIRRTTSADQYTLGRAFLQEAYIVVDWERGNFTIGQAIAQNKTSTIVPILSPTRAATSYNTSFVLPPSTPPHKSNAGMIAGIVVALIAIIAIVAGFLIFRRRRGKRLAHSDQGLEAEHQSHGTAEFYPPEKSPSAFPGKLHSDQSFTDINRAMSPSMSEMDSGQYKHERHLSELDDRAVHEMEGAHPDRELMSTPVYELQGEAASSEMGGSSPASPRSEYFGAIDASHRHTGPTVASASAGDYFGAAKVTTPLLDDIEEQKRSTTVSPLSETAPKKQGTVSPLNEDGPSGGGKEATITVVDGKEKDQVISPG